MGLGEGKLMGAYCVGTRAYTVQVRVRVRLTGWGRGVGG